MFRSGILLGYNGSQKGKNIWRKLVLTTSRSRRQSKQERAGAACARHQADLGLQSLQPPPIPGHLALLSLPVTVTTAATVLPHLGNMKHSPKIHIKRPTNKSDLKVRAVAARARDELFWEAAEDKCCWCLGNAGHAPEHREKGRADWPAGRCSEPEAARWTVSKLFGVRWGGPLMHHLVSSGTPLLSKLVQFLCQRLKSEPWASARYNSEVHRTLHVALKQPICCGMGRSRSSFSSVGHLILLCSGFYLIEWSQ